MFLEKESYELRKEYIKTLKSIGALSNLFSESESPYLGYRAVENVFCKCLIAKNLSRTDCSADASKNRIGFGIKTFLNGNGKTFQKIAEFNGQTDLYLGKSLEEMIKVISDLRNERIRATKRIHGLDELIYHCVVREPGKVKVFECNMDEITVEKISDIKYSSKNIITFKDNKNSYKFNVSKSTLYKKFITTNIIEEFDVEIFEDPYELVKGLMREEIDIKYKKYDKQKKYICLPLFSDRGKRNVPERSGLNQWNANGRKRDINEVYIPIPAIINKTFPDFFPEKNVSFKLTLPDGNNITAKVCQDGNKALMSNPNLDLGKWILRQVMNLKEGEVLTYKKLQELNIDSVIIYKEIDGYSINFLELGSYDEFIEEIGY